MGPKLAAALAVSVLLSSARAAADVEALLSAPESVELGDPDAKPEVEIRGQDWPLQVHVGSLTPTGQGSAAFIPPTQKFPQVVIVSAASADNEHYRWRTIRLRARATLKIQSERNASVMALVGENRFGPVVADRRGRARVPVVVPPGVDEAITIATDALGNETRVSLPLGSPPFSRLAIHCPKVGERILTFAVDETGEPLSGASIEFSTDQGTLVNQEEVEPGVYSVEIVSPHGRSEGQAMVSAVLTGAPTSAARCVVALPGKYPVAVRMSAGVQTVSAGAKPIALQIELDYAEGKRRQTGISVQATTGKVEGVRDLGRGKFEALWTPPDDLAGAATAKLVAETVKGPKRSGQLEVGLEPGTSTRVRVELDSSTVRADGKQSATVRARLFDRYKNPVRVGSLSASAQGQITAMTLEADGWFVGSYTAPRSYELRSDQIVVTESATGVRGGATVYLVPLPRRFRVDARLGYLTNLAKVSAPIASLGVAVRLTEMSERLFVGGNVSFYRASETRNANDGAEPLDLEVQGVPVLARVNYHVPWRAWTAYAGGEMGLVFARTTTSSERTGMQRTGNRALSVGGLLGAQRFVGRGFVRGELGYRFSRIDESTVKGNVGGVHFSVGYGLDL